MNAFSEQLSAARKVQFDAQLEFARAVTAQAFTTAQQVLALNISTSRAQVERSTSTLRQLLSINDPRDLFALGSNTQEQLSSMFDYGRELFNIVADARVNLSRGPAGVPAPQPEAQPQAESAPAVEPKKKKAAQQPPVAVDTDGTPDLPAKAKPIAKAVRKVAGKGAAPKPAASQLAIDAALDANAEGSRIVDLKRAAPAKAPRKKAS